MILDGVDLGQGVGSLGNGSNIMASWPGGWALGQGPIRGTVGVMGVLK